MKKIFLGLGMASFLLAGMFGMTSCSNEIAYNPSALQEKKLKDYEKLFIEKYGDVSSIQSWDFTQSATRTTRAEAGETSAKIEQLSFDDSAFDWIWKDAEAGEGVMNQQALENIYDDDLDDIKSAISTAQPKTWNPANYQTVLFRLFAASTNRQYNRLGVHVPSGENYWLVQAYEKLGWSVGTLFMDHVRCLDFSALPEGAFWFNIAQSVGTQENKVYASEHKVVTFKEVEVNGNTFWAFDCDGDGDYSNLVLWVMEVQEEEPEVIAKRYMVEDLGGQGDFDFNDIVFDVIDNGDEQVAIVRALGGTLDIAIQVGNNTWRKSLEKDVKTMYNTQNINYDGVEATFNVTGWDPEENNVKVTVYGDTTQDATWEITFPKAGTVPQMVAVKVTKKWMQEFIGVSSLSWFSED